MAEVTEEQFKDKVEEVVGDLGIAIAAIFRPEQLTVVVDARSAWRTLGRSFAELIEMGPPD